MVLTCPCLAELAFLGQNGPGDEGVKRGLQERKYALFSIFCRGYDGSPEEA